MTVQSIQPTAQTGSPSLKKQVCATGRRLSPAQPSRPSRVQDHHHMGIPVAKPLRTSTNGDEAKWSSSQQLLRGQAGDAAHKPQEHASLLLREMLERRPYLRHGEMEQAGGGHRLQGAKTQARGAVGESRLPIPHAVERASRPGTQFASTIQGRRCPRRTQDAAKTHGAKLSPFGFVLCHGRSGAPSTLQRRTA